MTLQDKLEASQAGLKEFDKACGLGTMVHNEVQRYMELDQDGMRKLTKAECDEASVLLYRFAAHVQKRANEESSIVKWAEETIRHLIAPVISNQKGYAFEERRMNAVRGNDAAQNADSIRVTALLKVERIQFLANRISDVAKGYAQLGQSRRPQ